MKWDYVNIHTHRPTLRACEPHFEGLHPWRVDDTDCEEFLSRLRERLTAENNSSGRGSSPRKTDLIGETGLDYACTADRHRQEEIFLRHIELAEEFSLPMVLHTVKSFERTMTLLKGRKLRAVIFHGFIGSVQQALRATDAGYYLSFGERSLSSPKTVAAMKAIPPSKLFLETDDAETTIVEIYARANAILGGDIEQLKKQILKNYEDIFERNE